MTNEEQVILKRITDRFIEKLNFRYEITLELDKLNILSCLTWGPEYNERCIIFSANEKDFYKNISLFEKEISNVLIKQMFFPSAKTSIGNKLVKVICKYL